MKQPHGTQSQSTQVAGSATTLPADDATRIREANKTVLIDHFLSILGAACHREAILPGDIFTGKKKSQWITRIREDLLVELRKTVGYAKDVLPRSYVIQPQGLDLVMFHPISYPVLGRLFGMDHSTMVLAHKRAIARDSTSAVEKDIGA